MLAICCFNRCPLSSDAPAKQIQVQSPTSPSVNTNKQVLNKIIQFTHKLTKQNSVQDCIVQHGTAIHAFEVW